MRALKRIQALESFIGTTGNYDVDYVYDDQGRVITENITGDGERSTNYTYDEKDNIKTEAVTCNGKTVTKTYTYDQANNITHIHVEES